MSESLNSKLATSALEKRSVLIESLSTAKPGDKAEIEAGITQYEDEARAYVAADKHETEVREACSRSRYPGLFGGARPAEVRMGHPLMPGQSFAGASGSASASDFGDYLRSLVYGNENRALGETLDNKGGFLVPTTYSASVLDLARNATRVVAAGAQIIPCGSDDQRLAKLVGDAVPGWRSEAAALAVSDMTLGEVKFAAKSMAVLVKASWELVEDAPNLGIVVRDALANAFAVNLDGAALYGSGVAPVPLGLRNTPGVTVSPLGANGGPLTWDSIVPAVQAVRTANYPNVSAILAERSEAKLASMKDTAGQYLTPPAYLSNVARYTTGLVPTNLTTGTAVGVSSDIFCGDFSQLAIGVRTQFELRALSETFASTGEIGFVGWLRADVQVLRPDAFQVISGIIS